MNDPPAKSRTLILINHPVRQKRQDFEEIKEKIEALAPEIDVRIVEAHGDPAQVDKEVWRRPCLIVSFASPLGFEPRRGLIFCCRQITKFEQIAKFNRAGIAVPRSALLEFGKPLDQNFWGPFVVIKPTAHGSMSQGAVHLMRTERVAQLAERVFPDGHPARRSPIMVQQFIDTGEWPSYYRVLTLFGEALYCRKYYTGAQRPPFDAPDKVLLDANISSAAPNAKRHAADDPDVLALARRTYAAMPAIPLQGVDIIREQATGRLFVLEANPGGNTWHFSSRYAARFSNTIPRAERIAQFGAWDVAARVLIKKTLEQAR